MKTYTYSPSTYALDGEHEWRRRQLDFRKTPICDHRGGMDGDDVTLYYPQFQKFMNDCNSIEATDLTFANKMCEEMSKYFKYESHREEEFQKLMNEFLQDVLGEKKITKCPYKDKTLGQKKPCKDDGAIQPCSCVILEVKNERHSTSDDAFSEVIAYYIQSFKANAADTGEHLKPVGRCPAPAFLLELVGPHLFISGAVYGRYVFVDRLVDPVWLVPHQREEAMIRIARIFKALKDAIKDIRQYYGKEKPIDQDIYDRYPIVKLEKKDKNKTEIIVNYTKAIEANMFEGTVDYENVIIYFVTSSSRERFIEQHSLRQQIKETATVKETTHYEAIIMEHKNNVTSFSDYLEKCKAQ